jgi:tetratricopeptide (TPR) repeat protein
MGYRAEAMKMLGRALEADPDYLPAVSTSAKYLLQQGLIDSARIFALKACSIDSSNSFARKSVLLIRMYDSLKITTDEPGRRELRLKIAELYNRIGLGDNAIDELRKMLCSDPYDRAALRSLGGMMEANSRYAPALRYYARLQKLEPEDAELQIKINSIRRKF